MEPYVKAILILFPRKEVHKRQEERVAIVVMVVTVGLVDLVMEGVWQIIMEEEEEVVTMVAEMVDILAGGLVPVRVVRHLFPDIADVMQSVLLQRLRISSIPDSLFIIPAFILAIPL